MQYDFAGWATRNNLRCSDGRTILRDAFAECDGKTVPLVWNHKHDSANNVLGHALLENRPEGVYCYGVFNNNPEGIGARELVRNGDISGLSIYANGLQHVNGRDVKHGTIREVSLVLAGANPGAYIDEVICHSEGDEEGAVIWTGMDFEELEHSADHEDPSYDPDYEDEMEHADENQNRSEGGGKTLQEVYDTLNEDQRALLYVIAGVAGVEGLADEAKHSDDYDPDDEDYDYMEHADGEGPTIQEVYNTFTPEQKKVVDILVGIAAEKAADAADEAKHSDDEEYYEDGEYEMSHADELYDEPMDGENIYTEDDTMQHNVFENNYESQDFLAHARQDAREMFAEAFADAKSYGSLKESVIAHGIEDIDILFPDAQTINNDIEFVSRNMDWVKVLMDGVHKTPFSRVKSIFADMTDEEARAKGYIKGNLKKEQVFALLKRETSPTTVYKKQKMHRDDLIDIDGRFDIVRYIRKELDLMLREEIARAALIGDGRDGSSEDKINPERIRPIWTDDDFFTIKYDIGEDTGRAFVEGAVKSRSQYKGSGNPVLFVTEQKLTELLLLTDAVGRDLFDSVDKLATKLRVSKIVTVPVMEGCIRVDKDANKAWALQGIIVNLNDYNMGTDRGGEIKTFDDFDIDYNAQKYLIETRCSGALIKPFSAIVLETAAEMPVGD